MKKWRIKGKGHKQLKADFEELRSAFHLKSKQLSEAREARELIKQERSKVLATNRRYRVRLKEYRLRYRAMADKLREDYKNYLTGRNKIEKQLREEVKKRDRQLAALRKRSDAIVKLKLRERSLSRAKAEIVKRGQEISSLKGKLKRAKEKPAPKKTPLPEKITRLVRESTITQGKVDAVAFTGTLLKFSNETGLSLRQMLLLLEGLNLNYFKMGDLLEPKSTTLRELEYKGLVQGDRLEKGRAVGWFLTKKGKEVAEILLERIYNNKNIKRKHLGYEDR